MNNELTVVAILTFLLKISSRDCYVCQLLRLLHHLWMVHYQSENSLHWINGFASKGHHQFLDLMHVQQPEIMRPIQQLLSKTKKIIYQNWKHNGYWVIEVGNLSLISLNVFEIPYFLLFPDALRFTNEFSLLNCDLSYWSTVYLKSSISTEPSVCSVEPFIWQKLK